MPDDKMQPILKLEDEQHFADMLWDKEALQSSCKPLYLEAKISMLSFIMMFLNIWDQLKVLNVAVNELLALLTRWALPSENQLPENHYHAKVLISYLGLNYNTIHACLNGFVLFRKEFKDLTGVPSVGKNVWSKEDDRYDQSKFCTISL
ncbi:hypothetical protein R1flu_019185 [Riccia fluitans]|uniref:Uncharacterized protein n=1 Tax=Riccia fluitans TaxID=41844 RepID=A0ABD1ZI93_9MARC